MSKKIAQVHIISVKPIPDATLEVAWTVSPQPGDGVVTYYAAAPATRGASFDGSGLPFANETQAFQGSATRGRATASVEGTYTAKIAMPNSYYAGLGTKLVPPALWVTYTSNGSTYEGSAKVADGIPFRTLSYPAQRTGPEFYAAQIPGTIMSQQALLYASAFPSTNPVGLNGR